MITLTLTLYNFEAENSKFINECIREMHEKLTLNPVATSGCSLTIAVLAAVRFLRRDYSILVWSPGDNSITVHDETAVLPDRVINNVSLLL